MLVGLRGIGQSVEDILAGADGEAVSSKPVVYTSGAGASDALMVPAFMNSPAVQPPATTTASTSGRDFDWGDLGKSLAFGAGSGIAASINRALGITPTSLAAQRAAAAKAPSTGPSMVWIVGGVAAAVLIGALLLRGR